MPGTVIGTSMNLGYPGTYSRNSNPQIAARQVKITDAAGPAFGNPVVLNSDNTVSDVATFIAAGGTFTLAILAGIAARIVKTVLTYPPTNAAGGYVPGDMCDTIRHGAVTVKCNVGTPTAGGAVFIRKALNGAIPLGIVGGYEAAADGSNTVAITNMEWTTGQMDANNTAEVSILIENTP